MYLSRKLSSILTISQDISYRELVKIYYKSKSAKVYHFPSFLGAVRAAAKVAPEVVILDSQPEDFVPARAFLQSFSKIQHSNPKYAPVLFLSQASAATLQEVSGVALTQLLHSQEQDFLALVPCNIDDLIEQLNIAIQNLI